LILHCSGYIAARLVLLVVHVRVTFFKKAYCLDISNWIQIKFGRIVHSEVEQNLAELFFK